jgi:endonuclease YncB( thermonuclease family)
MTMIERNLGYLRAVALSAGIAACLLLSCTKPAHKPSYPGARIMALSDIEFDDGDTFLLKREPIRVLGIDTPEIAHPDLGVNESQPFGVAASESTRVWMTRATLLEYVPDGLDRYDRRLAHVFVDGELLAIRLIEHALAYETVSHYGDSGFPDLAQRIVDASRAAPKPQFEPPYRWKRRQREKNR